MTTDGDRAIIEDLFRQHVDEIHGYLYRRAGQAGVDLVSEVFIVALRRVEDLPEPERRRAWLYGIARTLLVAEQRMAGRRAQAEGEHVRHRDATDGPGSLSDGLAAAVQEAMATLRPADRELIQLTEWERMSTAEAAHVLGIRPGTARVRLHRARRALANHPALRPHQPDTTRADHGTRCSTVVSSS